MADWVPILKQLALENNACYGAGIANGEDCELFVAADLDHEGLNWDSVYKDPYEFVCNDEAGNPITHNIDEKFTIQEVFEKKFSTNGIFLGGEKYTFASHDASVEVGQHSFECICAAKNKGGCHLIKTPGGYIVIVVYDEGRGQDKISSRMAAFALAEYLANNGM
ncbi:hypothetical protein BEWA_023530 [Theileria equi strain WA]|uniref:Profilin n=1 Tax=Theileria equi strain WA TaxID=1537102 RepID=L0AX88_THEEQ|nr:hypothetical protein BEWA_023530 [Theileria equi strain WA]AFZ79504.1 hypothetical protein BEWA_023530 [Theileria equi strain WA]|eukprot:XP_004829170.1 hypothetical protein BEWA_023530 [Theileria equi strain WA]